MSECDTCPDPGHCCRVLHLAGGDGMTFWLNEPPIYALIKMVEMGLPFVPIEEARRYREGSAEYRTFAYSCPMLGDDGRCTIYEDRPDLCREYQPRQDGLCVLPRVGE